MKKTLILAAIAFVCLFGLQAEAQVTNSSSTIVPINDAGCSGTDGAGGISDTIAFTEVGTISDVDVAVEIIHTWRGDLQFHVEYSVGAAGAVILAADHAGSIDNYYATFDDQAALPCSDATVCGDNAAALCMDAATAQTCQPDGTLAAFNGLTSPGTWTMYVCDDAGGDTGELQAWSVTLSGDGDLPVELMSFMVE